MYKIFPFHARGLPRRYISHEYELFRVVNNLVHILRRAARDKSFTFFYLHLPAPTGRIRECRSIKDRDTISGPKFMSNTRGTFVGVRSIRLHLVVY